MSVSVLKFSCVCISHEAVQKALLVLTVAKSVLSIDLSALRLLYILKICLIIFRLFFMFQRSCFSTRTVSQCIIPDPFLLHVLSRVYFYVELVARAFSDLDFVFCLVFQGMHKCIVVLVYVAANSLKK